MLETVTESIPPYPPKYLLVALAYFDCRPLALVILPLVDLLPPPLRPPPRELPPALPLAIVYPSFMTSPVTVSHASRLGIGLNLLYSASRLIVPYFSAIASISRALNS